MFLYAAAMILEFAALVWLRMSQPEMARPYRVPFGLAGAIAISIPPSCFVSSALRFRIRARDTWDSPVSHSGCSSTAGSRKSSRKPTLKPRPSHELSSRQYRSAATLVL